MTGPAPASRDLVLASASPRRRELLRQLGVRHTVCSADIDESRVPGESALDCVRRLAAAKASAVWRPRADPGLAVLGADTEVELDGELLGKPRDRSHGLQMLARLSGREHRVISAVHLLCSDQDAGLVTVTTVAFAVLDPATAAAYWDSGEPLGKAGGYAVQGFGAAFIRHLAGSYSGVVGLPLCETAQLLGRAGVPMWHSSGA